MIRSTLCPILPALLWFAAMPALAGDVAALTISNGNVSAYDASGSYCCSISGSGNAIDAQTDGCTIAVLFSNRRVEIYDASGSYRGTLYADGCIRIQVVRGHIILHKSDGRATIYTASGSYCCSV